MKVQVHKVHALCGSGARAGGPSAEGQMVSVLGFAGHTLSQLLSSAVVAEKHPQMTGKQVGIAGF